MLKHVHKNALKIHQTLYISYSVPWAGQSHSELSSKSYNLRLHLLFATSVPILNNLLTPFGNIAACIQCLNANFNWETFTLRSSKPNNWELSNDIWEFVLPYIKCLRYKNKYFSYQLYITCSTSPFTSFCLLDCLDRSIVREDMEKMDMSLQAYLVMREKRCWQLVLQHEINNFNEYSNTIHAHL